MPFIYQKWIKWESETAIINALYDGDKRFGELLDLTDLSKPVLIKRLKELKKKGKIDFVPNEETRRFSYHLIMEKTNIADEIQKKVDTLSKFVVTSLKFLARDPETSNVKYAETLRTLINILFRIRMLAHNTAPRDVQSEWLKTSLGMDFKKNIAEIYPENRDIYPEVTPFWELEKFDFNNRIEALKGIDKLLDSYFKTIEDTHKKSFGV